MKSINLNHLVQFEIFDEKFNETYKWDEKENCYTWHGNLVYEKSYEAERVFEKEPKQGLYEKAYIYFRFVNGDSVIKTFSSNEEMMEWYTINLSEFPLLNI